MQQPPLAPAFLAHAKGRFAEPTDVTALEALLGRTVEDARAQWPGVMLPAEAFLRHLAERLPESSPPAPLEALLGQLSLSELYLACACAHGIPAALATFERAYLSRLPGLLASLKQPAATIDDVCQTVRLKTLVRTPESAPRILEYTGRGALMSWTRVIASRIALKQIGSKPTGPDEGVEAVLDALPAPGVDTELDLIKQRHRAEFLQAVREAFSALSSEDRHLLRLYFVDRLSTTELGGLFRVNQSTASRRLKTARQAVYEETKRRLQERLGLSTRDYQSFLAVLDSQLDLSISQLFREEDAPAASAAAEPGEKEPREKKPSGG